VSPTKTYETFVTSRKAFSCDSSDALVKSPLYS